ncbi:threonine/serine exporter family protein [Nonomuraea bangladeshensis]|uniref:threonine/serine exporter family protein n=1 Tax=Nonomuraea bangladeshensis TaxID=404385 RepID=UPI0031DF08DE
MLSIAVRTLSLAHLSLPPSLAVLLAATVLGTVASRLAPRLRLPAGALVTPAIGASLLPGPDMYRSLSAYAVGPSGAGRQLLSALIVTVAIGAGIVLGNILGVKRELREKQTPQEQQ